MLTYDSIFCILFFLLLSPQHVRLRRSTGTRTSCATWSATARPSMPSAAGSRSCSGRCTARRRTRLATSCPSALRLSWTRACYGSRPTSRRRSASGTSRITTKRWPRARRWNASSAARPPQMPRAPRCSTASATASPPNSTPAHSRARSRRRRRSRRPSRRPCRPHQLSTTTPKRYVTSLEQQFAHWFQIIARVASPSWLPTSTPRRTTRLTCACCRLCVAVAMLLPRCTR